MKKMHPEAFKWLVMHDEEAGRIAAFAGWSWVDEPTIPTDKEREAVASVAQEAIKAIRRANIPKCADPDDQLKALAASSREEFRKSHGRYPGELSPNNLERLREQNPILKRAAENVA